jgi:hypothetical protein
MADRLKIQTKGDLVNFILANNLPAVNNKLMELGVTNSPMDKGYAYALLENLTRTGQAAIAAEALKVPYKTDAVNGTENYLGDLVQIKSSLEGKAGVNRAVSSVPGSSSRVNGGQLLEDIVGIALGGVTGLVNGFVGNLFDSDGKPDANTSQPNSPGIPGPIAEPNKNYTIWYIIGGLVLLVVAIIITIKMIKK